MRMNFSKLWLVIICLLIVLQAGMPFAVAEGDLNRNNSDNEPVVKVAYCYMGEYFKTGSSGEVISYDTEVLKKLSHYLGVKFEFVDCGNWKNAHEMLKNRQVDLVGLAQWSQERAQTFIYCDSNYGNTVGVLTVPENSKIIYEDYEAIGNSVIGCTDDYIRYGDLITTLERHNLHPVIKQYGNERSLKQALDNGEIDIAATHSHTMYAGTRVIEKFSYNPYFFMTWKGNEEFMHRLNDAIVQLRIHEPEFSNYLSAKYFPSLLGEPLSKAERELVNKNEVYTIYYNTDIRPLAWYNEDTHSMEGTLVDACKQISKITGLHLRVRPEWEKPEAEDNNTVKVVSHFTNFTVNPIFHDGTTDPVFLSNFNLFHRIRDNIDFNKDNYTIGYVGSRTLLNDYLKEQFPHARLIMYSNPEECLEKLSRGDVDMVYLNIHIANNILAVKDLPNVQELPIDEITTGFSLVFQGPNAEILKSIVNKSIAKIDINELANVRVQSALTAQKEFSLAKFIRENPLEASFIAVMAMVVIISIVALITYARVMRSQREKVEKANHDRTDFFARMSHDMRTPMNGILGMLALSQKSSDLADIHTNLAKAQDSGEYMLSLINDTLDLQKLESGKMELKYSIVSLEEYYASIYAMFQSMAKKSQVELRFNNINDDEKRYVKLDEIRVKQIFNNIISNAIKFTPVGGAVAVSMECLEVKANITKQRYTIRDTGIGMSKEFMEKQLFSPYSQENNTMTSNSTGTGLGLAITKNLVDMMGGTIDVASEPGEGTCFTIVLSFPVIPAEQAKKELSSHKNHTATVQENLKGRNLLLCEDNELNAEIATRLLEMAECQVTWAENGQIAVEMFEASALDEYDAILMDIRMPVMNGIEATKVIRSLSRQDAQTVPIIAMTANAYESDKEMSMEAGMNAHLAKPVEPQVLYETLAKYVKARLEN